MLVDELKQHAREGTGKLVHGVSQLRQNTDKGIQLVRNEFKKLASNVNDKINRYVKIYESKSGNII